MEIQKGKELKRAYERREKQRQVHLEKLEKEQERLARGRALRDFLFVRRAPSIARARVA